MIDQAREWFGAQTKGSIRGKQREEEGLERLRLGVYDLRQRRVVQVRPERHLRHPKTECSAIAEESLSPKKRVPPLATMVLGRGGKATSESTEQISKN